MDFLKVLVPPLAAPRWYIDRLIAVDTWKAEIRVITEYSQEWVEGVCKQINDAAGATTMHNWDFATECMDRIKAMAMRGDNQEQLNDWIENLPNELLMTLERERLVLLYMGIYTADYPGGPGAIFNPTTG